MSAPATSPPPTTTTASRPATAMDFAMRITAKAVADAHSEEARLKAKNLAAICNKLAWESGLLADCSDEALHGRIQRQYLHRPYLFLPPDCATRSNVAAMEEMEFEPDGIEIKVRPKPKGRTGTRA